MAQKEPDNSPSLELPSLFGRRKRRPQAEGDTATVAPPDEAVTEPVTEPVSEPVTEPVPEPVTAPAVENADPEHTAVIPVVEEPVVAEPVDREPVAESAVVEQPVVEQPAMPAVTPTAVPRPTPAAEAPSVTPAKTPKPKKDRRKRSAPQMAASTAAILVGAAVGLMGCVLTFLGLRGCELVTGTGSCGGPGLLVLVVILVLMILAGAAALRALGVAEAGNVSFLGVGIMTAIALLFLINFLYNPWMFAVVPVLTAVSFAVARWISTLYAEDLDNDDGGMPHHDIR